MTVTVDTVNVVVQPVVLSASVAVAPVDADVSSPLPLIVDVSPTVLSADVSSSAPSVTLAVGGAQGIPGPAGAGSSTITRTTAYALSGHRAVTADDDGLAIYATSDDLDHLSRPVWLTTGAWNAAAAATLTTEGDVTESSWNWTPGLPIWLGVNGVLTQTIPLGALFVREIAEVVDPQTIVFRPQSPIVKG